VAILITVVFLISTTSKYTWKLISDENFCTDRVSEEINIIVEKNNKKEMESLFKRLFAGLNYSIKHMGFQVLTNI